MQKLSYGHFEIQNNGKILIMPILFLDLVPPYSLSADRVDYTPLRADYHGGDSRGVLGRNVGLGAGSRMGKRVLSPAALRPRLRRSVAKLVVSNRLQSFNQVQIIELICPLYYVALRLTCSDPTYQIGICQSRNLNSLTARGTQLNGARSQVLIERL
jgi:hypothetical protein